VSVGGGGAGGASGGTNLPGQQPPDPSTVAPAPLRNDLVERRQKYLGREYIIFKNRISLGYFRLPEAHARAARLFDGRKKLPGIAAELRRDSLYWRAMPVDQAVGELLALAGQLASAGLLRVRATSAGERARRLKEAKKKRIVEMTVMQTLFFKKALVDPDRLLERMLPFVRWIYHPAVLLAAAAFLVFTLLTAIEHADTIHAYSANFFTLQNLALSWVLFLGVKVVHEFGHGLTCKRFGGEVHEMGFMFILFTPYLYCNVSDSWLARRGQRIAVTAAGILVELFLAAVATWLWLFSQPGLFHQLCFNTMFLCSISTVLFNANPLMKFDGYYIMTDLLEIPNLRAKSNAWVTAWAQRNLLGIRSAPRINTGEVGPLFGLYAVAAYSYGWFILYMISVKMFDILEPYGLQVFSRAYVGLFLFVSLGLPLWRLISSIKGNAKSLSDAVPRLRAIVVGAVVAGCLLAFLPMHESFTRSAVLEHAKVSPVSSPLGGFLRDVRVTEGAGVRAGDFLGRLENPDVEAQLADSRRQREAAEVRLRASLGDPRPEARLSVPVLEKYVSEIDEQIHFLEERMAGLELRAPVSGVLRTPRPADLEGQRFGPGQPVFSIGDPAALEVLVAMDERQARRVVSGQKVEVRFEALPGRKFTGRIVAAPVSPATELAAPALANLFGGDVPSEIHPSGHPVPSVPHFEARALIEIPPADAALLRAQAAARAKVSVRSTSLGVWLRDAALDLIDPHIRL
jgi:putative peptide zinc metalloprotease protein